MTQRRLRNEAVVWIALLLLQQFQVILMINLQAMKDGADEALSRERKGLLDGINPKRDNDRTKRQSKQDTDIDEVLTIFEEAVQLYQKHDKRWHEKVKDLECSFSTERKTRAVWSENEGLVLPLYLTTSALTYRLKHCHRLMIDQLEELVRIVGVEEAVEYIRYTIELLEGQDESEEENNDEMDDDDLAIDPESRESSTLNEVSYIIALNIHTTEKLADVFLSFNSSTLRTFDGIDDMIEGSINEFLVMSSMLDANTMVRRKRDTIHAPSRSQLNLKEAQRKAIETYTKQFRSTTFSQLNTEMKKSFASKDIQLTTNHMKLKRNMNIENFSSMSKNEQLRNLTFTTSLFEGNLMELERFGDSVSLRVKRESHDLESSDIVFIKNSRYACSLLTFQNGKLFFTKFDELSITSQIWVLSKGYLQHYQTGYFMKLSAGGIIQLDKGRSSSTFKFDNKNIIIDNICKITTIDRKDEILLRRDCEEKQHLDEWMYVSLGDARDNIALITCLFFIQKTDSCKVLTNEENSLTLNILNEHDVENQLWYWDYSYIRHSRTHKYLTSSWIGSHVSLSNLDDDICQRWEANNHSLNALDLPKESVLVLKENDIRVGYKYENSRQDFDVRLVDLAMGNISTCEYNSEYFAIKHDDFPCLVLCVRQNEAESHFTTKLLAIVVSLAVAIPSGLLFLICFDGKEAVIAGLLVGFILAAVAALVAWFSTFFRIQYRSGYFDIFDTENSSNCLWYQFDDGIKNVQYEQYITLEQVGANDFQTIRLSDKLKQGWVMNEKSIQQLGHICGLSVTHSDNENINSVEALQFECTEVSKEADKWNIVKATKSASFKEQTTCMYFLRQTSDKKDCGVLTVNATHHDIKLQSSMPLPSRLFDQLWYKRGHAFYNLGAGESFNISATEVETSMEKIPLTDEQAETGFSSGCTRNLYFIKSEWDTCTLLTYKNDTGENMLAFHEYDQINYFQQLWEKGGGVVRNFASNYVLRSNISDSRLVMFNEDFISYADKILCPFFLQQQEPPCGLLSVDKNDGRIFFGPVTSDLAEGQLWYKSDKFLVHLKSGKSLTLKDNGKFELSSDQSFSAGYYYNEKGTDAVFIQDSKTFVTHKWRKIHSVEAFDDFSVFQCSSSNRSYFFIKEKNNPCVVLTTGEINHEPYFEVFDEKNAQAQLWYLESSRLINLYSGLVLKQQMSGSKYIMTEQLYYDPFQDIEVLDEVGNLKVLGNQKFDCFMKTVSSGDFKSILCSKVFEESAAWEFVGYHILEDISQVKCLFYIRSTSKPCEFLTGYDEGNSLKIRPLTDRLIQNQIFYTKGDLIIHQQTGLILSSVNLSLALLNKNFEYDQTWLFENSQLKVKDKRHTAITFDPKDGTAKVENLEVATFGFGWSKVPLNFDFEKDESENPDCSENIDLENVSPFFIMSTSEKCVVLTSSRLGEVPVFTAYDKDNLENQLWYFHDSHIINVGTEMVIMVEFDELSDDHDIVMWEKYKFSAKQKFRVDSSSTFRYLRNDKCVPASINTERGVTISLQCDEGKQSDLTVVNFDDKGDFIDKISCLFFIKTTTAPCELLTVVGNSIKMRPLSEKLVAGQLWFWKNKQLVNSKSNQILTITNEQGNLALSLQRMTTGNHIWQNEWVFNNGYIKSLKHPGRDSFIVGFYTDSDIVQIKSISHQEKLCRQWVFVDKNDGLNLAANNKFHCEKDSDLALYVVRSEHNECPLLNVVGGDKVGYKEVDDSGGHMEDSLWWTRQKDHICNARHSLCLSVSSSSSHAVQLEPRYAFKRGQKWTIQNDRIEYLYGLEKLIYTGSHIILSSDHHDDKKQIWKWYSSAQIEDDPKNLRCSRCYDKSEEKAAEIISWIPFVSLFYNIGRSIAYAVKQCPKIALSALLDSLIDIAMDAVMVLSAGSASAIAFGVKTALKFGLKAGLKAFANGIKSMIKVAIKSVTKGIVNFVKTGFRRTLKQQLTKMKLNIKNIISTVKKIPATLKTITKATASNFKKYVKTSIRSMKTVVVQTKSQWKTHLKGIGSRLKSSLKTMPRKMKIKFSRLGIKLKGQLKELNDKLAKKAENAVKKADDIKFRGKIRCKRGNEYCGVSIGITPYQRIKTMQNYLNNGKKIENVPNNLKHDMNTVYQLVGPDNGQKAAVGLKTQDGFSFTDHAIISKEGLRDKAGNLVAEANTGKHTEPFLMNNLETHVKQCSSEKPCKVFMFTKLSPCHSRQDDIEACLSVITRKCEEWLYLYSTKCFVSFETFYDNELPFADWSNLLTETIKRGKFPDEFGRKNIDEILSDAQSIATISTMIEKKFDNILLDINIHKRLEEVWPGKVETNFFNFYKDLSAHVQQNLRNKLDDLRKSDAIQNAVSKHAELDKFYKDLVRAAENSEDPASLFKELDLLKKTAASSEVKRNAAFLYNKVTQMTREQLKKREELVKKLSVQVRDKLDHVSKKATITELLSKSTQDSNNAVKFYRFHKDKDIYKSPPGNDAG